MLSIAAQHDSLLTAPVHRQPAPLFFFPFPFFFFSFLKTVQYSLKVIQEQRGGGEETSHE